MTRVEPSVAESWGFLAGARRVSGDQAGAILAFERACELAPAWEWAGANLFDMRVESGDLDGAASTIETLGAQRRSPAVLERLIRLARLRLDGDEALARFREFCLLRSATEDALEASAEELAKVGWMPDVLSDLQEHVDGPEPRPAATACWVKLCVRHRRQHVCEARLRELLGRGAVGTSAAAAFLGALGARRDRRSMARFIRQQGYALRNDTALWGQCGYAVVSVRRYRALAAWMTDWRTRAGVKPWMLLNLVVALRNLNRWPEAHEAGLYAERLDARRLPGHDLWLALDAALAGNDEELRERLGRIDCGALQPYYRYVYDASAAVGDLMRSDPARRAKVFKDVRGRLDQPAPLLTMPAIALARQRCAWRLASLHCGLMGRLWLFATCPWLSTARAGLAQLVF